MAACFGRARLVVAAHSRQFRPSARVNHELYWEKGTIVSGQDTDVLDIIVEQLPQARLVTLNRPSALNALNLSMIRRLGPLIEQWERLDIGAVILKGAGGKAFCAGGDVVSLCENGQDPASRAKAIQFFAEEYALNHLLGSTNTPIVSLLNGFTMGGGVGLSVHGQFRVATESTVFSMPETAIGLFPDVGGTFFLPRLKGGMGMYLGLTGARLKGQDVVTAGVATHFVADADLSGVVGLLAAEARPDCDYIRQLLSMVESPQMTLQDSPTPLEAEIPFIDAAFGSDPKQWQSDTVEAVVARLSDMSAKAGSSVESTAAAAFADRCLAAISRASPTSVKVTHQALARGAYASSLSSALRAELGVAAACMEGPDFFEGVRALLVEKDNAPAWSPPSLEAVSAEAVDAFFPATPFKSAEFPNGLVLPKRQRTNV